MRSLQTRDSSSSCHGGLSALDASLLLAVAPLNKTALAVAVGVLGALIVSGATILLIIKGGPLVGPTLALLGQYFPGYTVTTMGSVIGGLYGFLTGFLLGWLTAAVRNAIVTVYIRFVAMRATLAEAQTFMDDL